MLIVTDPAHLDRVRTFAASLGATDRLQTKLDRLDGFSGDRDATRGELFPDPAPHSFFFRLDGRTADGGWQPWFVGGLVYSGPGQPLDGAGPAYCVGIGGSGAEHDWSIHT